MKVSLIVGEGVHAGKVIPIPIAQFLIGRDEGCHLRPSSPAVSKRHCALIVKGGKLWVKDFGSTNGTFLNDQQVTEEVEAKDGDSLRVGPLLFKLKVERTVVKPAATPQPNKPASVTPDEPAPVEKPAAKPATTAAKTNSSDATTDEEAVSLDVDSDHETNSARILAMLMSDEEGPTPAREDGSADNIPNGTTVMEIPSLQGTEKKDKAAAADKQSTSKAAEEILRKIRQRPRG